MTLEAAIAMRAAEQGTVAVDLDGTLAKYDGYKGAEEIGEPVPAMLKRVKDWLKTGRRVVIFTARVASDRDGKKTQAIERWCLKYLGRSVDVTALKTPDIIEFWDDRAHRVERNTGKLLASAKFAP